MPIDDKTIKIIFVIEVGESKAFLPINPQVFNRSSFPFHLHRKCTFDCLQERMQHLELGSDRNRQAIQSIHIIYILGHNLSYATKLCLC